MECIDKVIDKLREQETDIKVEGGVSGLSGVHISRDDNYSTTALIQPVLAK